jgi:hypothetical protein
MQGRPAASTTVVATRAPPLPVWPQGPRASTAVSSSIMAPRAGCLHCRHCCPGRASRQAGAWQPCLPPPATGCQISRPLLRQHRPSHSLRRELRRRRNHGREPRRPRLPSPWMDCVCDEFVCGGLNLCILWWFSLIFDVDSCSLLAHSSWPDTSPMGQSGTKKGLRAGPGLVVRAGGPTRPDTNSHHACIVSGRARSG